MPKNKLTIHIELKHIDNRRGMSIIMPLPQSTHSSAIYIVKHTDFGNPFLRNLLASLNRKGLSLKKAAFPTSHSSLPV
jgi:hypothetical protein